MSSKGKKKPRSNSNVNPPENTKRPRRGKALDALNPPQDLPLNTKTTNTAAKKKTSSTTSRPKETLLALKSPCLDLLSNSLDSNLATSLLKLKLDRYKV